METKHRRALRGLSRVVTLLTVVLLALIAIGSAARAAELAGWDVWGLYGFGPSPMTPTTAAANLTIGGLTRGKGVVVSGSASGNAWGGVGVNRINTETDAISTNEWVTFSVTANAGNKISCTTIPAYNIRRSASGATTGRWQYQVGTGAFNEIGSAITWGGNTSATGNSQSAIDLSGIAALQNVVAGTTITFRLVLWGVTGATGTWYINDLSTDGDDLQVQGTVTSTVTTPTITTVPTAGAISYGQTLANATLSSGVASVAGSFAFTSPSIKPAVGMASQSVTFTPTDTASYNPVVFNVSVTVTPAASHVALASSAGPAGYGDCLVFSANLSTDATGSVVFSLNGLAVSTNNIASGSAVSPGCSTLPRGTNSVTAGYGGDVNYFGSTNTLAQIVTNHPPVATGTSYVRSAAAYSLHMVISNLLANVVDVDHDAITLVGTSLSTNGIALTCDATCLTYRNTNAVNDQFTYTVTDGFGGTNSATVDIVINTNFLGGQVQSFSLTGGNHAALLNFFGIPNYGYAVQRSTNLTDWADVLLTNAPANGAFQFVDDLGDPPAQLYYRLRSNP